jgi:hypothetical protein
MKGKIIIATIVVLVVAFAFFIYIDKRTTNAFSPTITKEIIVSKELGEVLYLKGKAWGVTDDRQIIVLSKSEENNFDVSSKDEYIFKGVSVLFYEVQGDTLRIYIEEISPVPDNFNTGFKIEQHKLENPELMQLYKTYKKKGIKKFGSSLPSDLPKPPSN